MFFLSVVQVAFLHILLRSRDLISDIYMSVAQGFLCEFLH